MCLHLVRPPETKRVYANDDLQRKYEAARVWLRQNRTAPHPKLGLYERMLLDEFIASSGEASCP